MAHIGRIGRVGWVGRIGRVEKGWKGFEEQSRRGDEHRMIIESQSRNREHRKEDRGQRRRTHAKQGTE
jgi:hypothetical protein